MLSSPAHRPVVSEPLALRHLPRLDCPARPLKRLTQATRTVGIMTSVAVDMLRTRGGSWPVLGHGAGRPLGRPQSRVAGDAFAAQECEFRTIVNAKIGPS